MGQRTDPFQWDETEVNLESHLLPMKAIVLCDFDGTITPEDTSNFLYTRFADVGTQFAEQWDRGEISTPEELRETFATIHATREEMEAVLRTIPLDPDFPAFFQHCQDHGYRFAVISDALDWSIRVILENHGLTGIEVFSNVIHFTEKGFTFEHPWYRPENPHQGTSKPTIVRSFQESGWTVLYIGDGKSDFQAAQHADKVYARSALSAYCRENGIAHVPFECFADLIAVFSKEG